MSSLENNEGAENAMRNMDFFAYTGSSCSPAFCINLNTYEGIDEAYNKCSPLSTVIGRNALSMANAKWWVTDEKDENVIDKYPNLKSLLKKPNPLQSWDEFIIQLDTYRQLDGEVFVWAAVPVGYTVADASSLWVIRRNYINIIQTKKLYNQTRIDGIISKYYLNIGNEKTELNKEHILHIKDTYQNLNFSPTNIRGVSRIKGLEDPIKNIVIAHEAIYSLNKDRGAQGIISNETKDKIGNISLTPLEIEQLQKTYEDNYGLLKNQFKIIFSNNPLRWQQMSYNVKDLMLFEGIQENVKQITDAYGYPYDLLSNDRNSTFTNKLEAKKWYYQDTIIPIAKIYSEKFTSFFGIEDRLYADFSEVESLKEAELSKADALHRYSQAIDILYKAGLISLEEARSKIDMDSKIEGGTMYEGQEAV